VKNKVDSWPARTIL